jgi:hypothetical protein
MPWHVFIGVCPMDNAGVDGVDMVDMVDMVDVVDDGWLVIVRNVV